MSELVVVEKLNIPSLFVKRGCDPLLKQIREMVSNFEPDVFSATGRKEIASMAHKVARSKTLLDGLGKDLTAEIKNKVKVVDVERLRIRTELDQLKEEVRRPLTEWEWEEKDRIAKIKARIEKIEESQEYEYTNSESIDEVLARVKAVVIDDAFAEFANEAAKIKDRVTIQLEAQLIVRRNQEKEQVERERLEKERIEKERKEREEKIATEAAERAKKEAEKKARLEAEEKERAAFVEAEEKERIARDAIEKAEREALESKLAIERAEREKREVAERVVIEKRMAVEAERKKIQEEQYREIEAAQKREKNKRHRTKIIREMGADMVALKDINNIIAAMVAGKIRHVKVEF